MDADQGQTIAESQVDIPMHAHITIFTVMDSRPVSSPVDRVYSLYCRAMPRRNHCLGRGLDSSHLEGKFQHRPGPLCTQRSFGRDIFISHAYKLDTHTHPLQLYLERKMKYTPIILLSLASCSLAFSVR
jgi:hypothetical protein